MALTDIKHKSPHYNTKKAYPLMGTPFTFAPIISDLALYKTLQAVKTNTYLKWGNIGAFIFFKHFR